MIAASASVLPSAPRRRPDRPTAMPGVAAMRRAFAAKDPAFDGLFVVAVKTTGIFCRPVCRAKPPKPENVEFYPTPAAAERQGYRPCKLCRPAEAAAAVPPAVDRLVRLADERTPDRVTSADLSAAGVDPATARRQFRRHFGVTFAAYQRSKRLAAAAGEARAGGRAVAAQVAAGFGSASGFRAAARKWAGGASPADLATAVVLTSARIPTPIGLMVAIVCGGRGRVAGKPAPADGGGPDVARVSNPCEVRGASEKRGSRDFQIANTGWKPVPREGRLKGTATPRLFEPADPGVVICDFEDRVGLATAVERARIRLGTRGRPALIVPGEHPLLAQLAVELVEYFAGRRRAFDVPMALGGTPFQRRAWDYLRQIPFGQTRSYARQAADLASPAAVRAVGRANGANYLSVLIPCHRVVAADGSLAGYGGGLARKRWLLDHERRVAGV